MTLSATAKEPLFKNKLKKFLKNYYSKQKSIPEEPLFKKTKRICKEPLLKNKKNAAGRK